MTRFKSVGSHALIRARSAAYLFSATQIFAKAFGFLLLLVAAIATRPSPFGQFIAATLVAAFLTLLLEFGASSAVIREATVNPTSPVLSSFVKRRVTRLWFTGSIFAVASVFVQADSFRLGLLVVSVGALMAGNTVAAAALLGSGRGIASGLPNLLYNIAGLAVVIVLLIFDRYRVSATLLFSSSLSGSVVAAASSFIALQRRGEFARNNGRIRGKNPDRAVSTRAGIVQVVNNIGDRIDLLAIGAILGAAPLGVYGLSSRFQDTATALPQIVTVGFQPRFIAGTVGLGGREFIERALYLLVIMCSFLGALLAWTGPIVVKHFLSSGYSGAIILVPILAAGVVSYAFETICLFAIRGASGQQLSTLFGTAGYAIRSGISVLAIVVAALVASSRGVAITMSTVDLLTFGSLAILFTRPLEWRLPGSTALLILAGGLGIGAAAVQAPSALIVPSIALPALIASVLLFGSSRRSVIRRDG